MLSRGEIKDHIERVLHLKPAHHAQYAERYDLPSCSFYIKSGNTRPIVVHPELGANLLRDPVFGVDLGDFYFNSALNKFPRLGGPNREPCGYDVEILDIPALEALLQRIGAIFAGTLDASPALTDIRVAEPMLAGLSATQRETLISARLGQGLFRSRLMSVWNGRCAVTGVTVLALLRASHIKPWRLSDNSERLDPENGLMLMANLDAAFDAGLVSFGDDGAMLFSRKLGPRPHEILGTRPESALTRRPSGQQQAFLRHHRDAANIS